MSQPAGSVNVAPHPVPPDRGHLLTEQRNPRTAGLDRLTPSQCVDVIIGEDAAAVAAVRAASAQIGSFVAAVAPGFCSGDNRPGTGCRRPGRLVYVGAGTSGRLGVLDASEAPPTFCVGPDRIIGLIAGGDAALRKSSESAEDDLLGADAELALLDLHNGDAVLAIAAGGTTPYALGALVEAKRLAPGCVTGLLTCTPVPPPPACDHLIVLETGPEVLTGSTRMKAGTATKMTLNAISTSLMVASGRVYQNLMVDLRASNAKLRDRAARVVCTVTGVSRPDALLLLDRADGRAKTAIVMQRLGVDLVKANALLEAAGGRLGAVIDSAGGG